MTKVKTVFLAVRLHPDVMRNIDNLAGAAHLDRSAWIKAWLGSLSNLRREYSLRALADIPPDRFKGLPGRPQEPRDDAQEKP